MEEDAKSHIGLVVGQTIGEVRALHRRLDSLERDITVLTEKFDRRPSRAERYLLVLTSLLSAILIASFVLLYRSWAQGNRIF